MPTENRSSNTEMVSVPRDLLARVSSAEIGMSAKKDRHQAAFELRNLLASSPSQPHPDPIAWMVGTAFWWTKEEAERDAAETGKTITPIGPMSGIAPAEEHQGEPAALPERKAITAHGLTALDSEAEGWNACLDEIAKLGPRYTHPVRGEPVGYMNQASIDAIRSHGQALIMVGVNGFPPGDKAIPLYTHADPGEVERLRAEVERLRSGFYQQVTDDDLKKIADFIGDGDLPTKSFFLRPDAANLANVTMHMVREVQASRAQLAERDALLESAAEGASILRSLIENIEAKGNDSPESTASFLQQALHCVSPALSPSASAEPSAPKCVPEKPSRCTSCDNCQGFNTGHDSTQQKPYSIRCDNCHKEARAADHTGLARAWNALNQGE
jgi:hypothetical protein